MRNTAESICSILNEMPQGSLTPDIYSAIVKGIDSLNRLEKNPLVSTVQVNDNEINDNLTPENEAEKRRLIAIILNDPSQKNKQGLPYFKDMNLQELSKWIRNNRPYLLF